MAKTERLYVRISPDMKEDLQKIASADGRSLSNYIENLLRQAIDQSREK